MHQPAPVTLEAKRPSAPPVPPHRLARVTVYEDRCELVRHVELDLPAGSHAITLAGLSGLIDEDRLVVHLEPVPSTGEGAGGVDDNTVSGAQVDDVRVVRRYGAADADAGSSASAQQAARRRALEAELAARQAERRRTEAAVRQAEAERDAAEAHLQTWLVTTRRRLGRGEAPAAGSVAQTLAAAQARLAAADDALLRARADDEALRRLLATLQGDATRLGRGPVRSRRLCDVVCRVGAQRPLRARLVVATVLPCGAWRPQHEATLAQPEAAPGQPAAATVTWACQAAVWNKTGESWDDVTLVLSTARPQQGATLPRLVPDLLTLRAKSAEERKTVFVSHRQEEIPRNLLQGDGGGKAKPQGAPGVDDGGEARVFTVPRATIPDDGRPHQVPLGGFVSPATLAHVCFPEQAALVFLRASLRNSGRQPLLAGPVTLKDAGGWRGTGDVAFVGAGEAFDLSFGSDDAITLQVEKKKATEKKLVGKDITHFILQATFHHTGREARPVLVHWRLPVSEVAQVKVVQSPQHGTEGEVVLDTHGIARLPVTLTPGAERKMAVAFCFDTSGDVVLDAPW